MVKKALYKRSEDPLQWFSSKMGLSVDTSCHAVAAVLLGIGILEWTEWCAEAWPAEQLQQADC